MDNGERKLPIVEVDSEEFKEFKLKLLLLGFTDFPSESLNYPFRVSKGNLRITLGMLKVRIGIIRLPSEILWVGDMNSESLAYILNYFVEGPDNDI